MSDDVKVPTGSGWSGGLFDVSTTAAATAAVGCCNAAQNSRDDVVSRSRQTAAVRALPASDCSMLRTVVVRPRVPLVVAVRTFAGIRCCSSGAGAQGILSPSRRQISAASAAAVILFLVVRVLQATLLVVLVVVVVMVVVVDGRQTETTKYRDE